MSWYAKAVEEWNDTLNKLRAFADDLDPIVQRALGEIPIDWLGQQRIVKKTIHPSHEDSRHVITWSAQRADVDYEASVRVWVVVDLSNTDGLKIDSEIRIFSYRDNEVVVGRPLNGIWLIQYDFDKSLNTSLERATLAYLDDLHKLRE